MKNHFLTILNKPVHIAPLVTFRIFFGLVMLFSILRFMWNGWVFEQYIQPEFFFPYYGFEWIKPLPSIGMYVVFSGLAISSLLILLGFFYRFSAITFFLLFTYVELIDKTNYLNHYYFISLVSFLLILVPAGNYFSIDQIRKKNLGISQIPQWMVGIFKLQLGLVYFYAGVAKLNPDWLFEALPLKIWLPAHSNFPILGTLFQYSETAYFFSWSGALYDLCIPFLLLSSKTRNFAYLAVVGFHTITWLLFPIGMFPFIMMGATLIFFSENFHIQVIHFLRNFFQIIFGQIKSFNAHSASFIQKKRNNAVLGILAGFFILQMILPWRYLLYPNHLFWTEEGFRFSWRVMLIEKAGYVTFHVSDPESGRKGEVYAGDYLTPNQEKMMSTQPDMILQFAHFLEEKFTEKGINDPVINAEAYVTLNGRGSRLFIDPEVDLTQEKESFKHKNWVLPFEATK